MQHGTERTDPWWVHRNETYTHVRHDHDWFGRPVATWRNKCDADGNVIVEPVVRRFVVGSLLGAPGFLPAYILDAELHHALIREALAMRSRGAEYSEVCVYDTGRTRAVREEVTVGHYADYCTEGMAVTRSGELAGHPGVYAPCSAWGTRREYEKTSPSYHSKYDYRDRRQLTRGQARARSRLLTRTADAGGDTDDLD